MWRSEADRAHRLRTQKQVARLRAGLVELTGTCHSLLSMARGQGDRATGNQLSPLAWQAVRLQPGIQPRRQKCRQQRGLRCRPPRHEREAEETLSSARSHDCWTPD